MDLVLFGGMWVRVGMWRLVVGKERIGQKRVDIEVRTGSMAYFGRQSYDRNRLGRGESQSDSVARLVQNV